MSCFTTSWQSSSNIISKISSVLRVRSFCCCTKKGRKFWSVVSISVRIDTSYLCMSRVLIRICSYVLVFGLVQNSVNKQISHWWCAAITWQTTNKGEREAGNSHRKQFCLTQNLKITREHVWTCLVCLRFCNRKFRKCRSLRSLEAAFHLQEQCCHL